MPPQLAYADSKTRHSIVLLKHIMQADSILFESLWGARHLILQTTYRQN